MKNHYREHSNASVFLRIMVLTVGYHRACQSLMALRVSTTVHVLSMVERLPVILALVLLVIVVPPVN